MLVVKVEMWPRGLESKKYEIVRAGITNLGTGSDTRGNYRVRLYDKRNKLWREATILNWPRKAAHVWRLVAHALEQACANTSR